MHFSPLLVRNTEAVPVDFRAFLEEGAPLHVDRWRLDRPGGRLEATRTLETGLSRDTVDDRRLRSLLRRYAPHRDDRDPDVEPAGGRRFDVLFFDRPGESASTWQEAFRERTPPQADNDPRLVYTHPFIRRVESDAGGERFEFVLQHWFFYPFNDGSNNHEGDWEHINVVLAPGGATTTALAAEQIRRILGPPATPPIDPDSLRLGRVEYYFHRKVMVLGHFRPNVYQPEEAWETSLPETSTDRLGRRWLWRRTRDLAHRGPAHAEANPHPVAYIGGNNKGLDQLLQPPGGSNRDSHGAFPLPGLYRDVAPARTSEAINAPLTPTGRSTTPTGAPIPAWNALTPRPGSASCPTGGGSIRW